MLEARGSARVQEPRSGICSARWSQPLLLCSACPRFSLQATPSRDLQIQTLVYSPSIWDETSHKVYHILNMWCHSQQRFPTCQTQRQKGSQPQLFLTSPPLPSHPLKLHLHGNLANPQFCPSISCFQVSTIILHWFSPGLNTSLPTWLLRPVLLLNHCPQCGQDDFPKGKLDHCTSLLKFFLFIYFWLHCGALWDLIIIIVPQLGTEPRLWQ